MVRTITMRIVLGILLAMSVCCVSALYLWRRNACEKEVLKITETSGIKFTVERESCDLLGKDEFISIYATRLPKPPIWKLLGRSKEQSLLFRYDPGAENEPLPTITLLTQAEIHIAIPSVSWVAFQQHRWNGKSISYDIGKSYFPNVPK